MKDEDSIARARRQRKQPLVVKYTCRGVVVLNAQWREARSRVGSARGLRYRRSDRSILVLAVGASFF